MQAFTWVEGADAPMVGPGLWEKGDVTSLDPRLAAVVQDLLYLDLHLSMGALIMGRHNPHLQHYGEEINRSLFNTVGINPF